MAEPLRRLHILVEGQTEETIARDVLEPHLRSYGWSTNWSIVKTKRPAGGPAYKGGVTSWTQLEREISLLLRASSLDVLTTMLLHEVEAWVFAASETARGGSWRVASPSLRSCKRLIRYCPGYIKTQDGPLAIAELGVTELRRTWPAR